MNLNNERWWTATKITSVIFNSFSTFTVFHATLQQSISSPFFVYAGTFAAIGLIDVLYIALINKLQAPYADSELIAKRWSYVIGLVSLYISILAIGLLDEGIMAIAPRVGLGIITLVGVSDFVFQWRAYQDEHWQENFEKKKLRIERRDQQKQLEAIRQFKNKQQIKALHNIEDALITEYMAKHKNALLTVTGQSLESHTPNPVMVDIKPKAAQTLEVSTHRTNQLLIDKPLRKGIKVINGNKYEWECVECGKEGHAKSYAGAKIAQSRHLNTHKNRIPA